MFLLKPSTFQVNIRKEEVEPRMGDEAEGLRGGLVASTTKVDLSEHWSLTGYQGRG